MKKILIIDDDVSFCKEMKDLLESYNFTVYYDTDGWGAVNMVRRGVDLILFDIKLPVFSGFYFIDLIKENIKTKRLPMFAITALSDEDNRKRAEFLGVNEYFVKPVDAKKLIDKINEYLGKK